LITPSDSNGERARLENSRYRAKLAQNDIKKDVLEAEIIALSELSESEVKNHLNELEWLHLAKEALPKASRGEFRL
jgi:hypothetical protein